MNCVKFAHEHVVSFIVSNTLYIKNHAIPHFIAKSTLED